jgi:hypothetical protein
MVATGYNGERIYPLYGPAKKKKGVSQVASVAFARAGIDLKNLAK